MGSAEVAVVGAGPSGLAAAFRLQQAGYRVRLFEANHYVGGKLRTSRRHGFLVEEGAAIMPTGYRHFLGIAEEAGLAGEIIPGGAVFGFARDDQIHYLDAHHLLRSAWRFKLLSRRSLPPLGFLLADIFRMRRDLSFEDLSRAAAADHETAGEYARRRLNPEILEFLVDPTVRGLVGTSADNVSNVDFLFSFSKFVGNKFVAFREGMSSYAEQLARRFTVQLEAPVTVVQEGSGGVLVSWQSPNEGERSEQFAGCVVAIPARQAVAVLPGLDPARQQFLRRVRYTKMVNLTVALGRAPAGIPATYIQVPASVHDGLIGILLDHNRAPDRVPAGKGLLSLYVTTEWAEELIDEDDAVVAKRLLESLEMVLPKASDHVEFTVVHRWDPMVVQSRVGQYRDLKDFNQISRTKDRLVQLAGDYFSSSNINSATAAGERAARDLVVALSQSP